VQAVQKLIFIIIIVVVVVNFLQGCTCYVIRQFDPV